MARRARGQHYTLHPWTPAQHATLVRSWGEVAARTLTERLRPHTWTAIRLRARQLGLPGGPPQGCVSVATAARRCGLSEPTLLRVCAWAEVPVQQVYPAAGTGWRERRHSRRRYVDELDVIAAVERWLRAERASHAAARLGVPHAWLWCRARAEGLVVPRRVTRLDPERWDELAASRLRGAA